MSKIFYIADTHFGHKNVLKYDPRPFSDTEEMENVMVDNWNRAVSANDTVYIVGDFILGKADEWRRILKRLRGKKVLIEGNHDLGNYPEDIKNMFVDIRPRMKIKDNGRTVILSHEPILFYEHSGNPGVYMLCGHVHTTKENVFLERFIRELKEDAAEHPEEFHNRAQIINVGCMMPYINYTPRTLDEIISLKEES